MLLKQFIKHEVLKQVRGLKNELLKELGGKSAATPSPPVPITPIAKNPILRTSSKALKPFEHKLSAESSQLPLLLRSKPLGYQPPPLREDSQGAIWGVVVVQKKEDIS